MSPGRAEPAGYDPDFLGVPVPLPLPTDDDLATEVLDYTHFTVVMRPDRRLAAATAVAIDGASLQQDVDRDDSWRLDPRLPATAQAGPEPYRNNRLDRGHLVRRLDPVWGTRAEAEQANADTFHYTNAAPQQDYFNQGKQLWAGLEDYLLDNAADHDRRLVVLTGCVFDPQDPLYRGVQVPLRFWKVAGFLTGSRLAATAYVLDQSPPEPDTRALGQRKPSEPPPLGPFRTFQVPVADIVDLTGLDLGPLPGVDRMPDPDATGTRAAGGRPSWQALTRLEDIAV